MVTTSRATREHSEVEGRPTPHLAWITAIFVLSGAAGLIYEVVWSRQLVLVFGNTTQAVSTILTGFFGGMAIGNLLGGRMADRVRSPLRLYAALELVLVAVVVATPVTFRLLHLAYRGAYGSLEGTAGLALLRFGLALLALAPATILMGATLPALTRQLGDGAHLSKAFGRLYAANTCGAIVGTLVAGLVLIELLGLTRTLYAGAALSAVAGLAALRLSAGDAAALRAIGGTGGEPVPDESHWAPARPRLALLLAFGSGLTSLSYQVLWTRLLSSGTGNLTYVFTLILAVFLAGIASGAVLFSAIRRRVGRSIGVLVVAQSVAAVLAIAGLVFVIGHPNPAHPGDPLRAAIGTVLPLLLVVLPTTVVLGFMLPASSALLGDDPSRVASSSGSLLASNTAGAIVGTFVVPFVVIPALGSAKAVALVAAVNVLIAAALLWSARRSGVGLRLAGRARLVPALAAGTAAAAVLSAVVVPGAITDPGAARITSAGGTILASAEDEIASVQAGRSDSGSRRLWVTGTSMTSLTVDAKLMPVLPMMLRPESRTALTVAFGMGSTFRSALVAGLRTDAAELVPSVPQMFGHFYADAQRVRRNPDGRVILADGRNHLELTRNRYDIIVTDPPPPIESSGASIISSLEYYEAGRARLNAGGVMMQWTPYGGTLDEVKAQLRTFRHVFPHVMVSFGPGGYGFYMFGSQRPLALTDDAVAQILTRPDVLADLSSAPDSPQGSVESWTRLLENLVWIQDDQVDAFTGDGPLITDDRPMAEYFLLRRGFGGSDAVKAVTLSSLAP